MRTYYHRSIPAAQIICGSIKLSAKDFHYLILTTTRRALEIKNSSGHSHGNLKPSNIFVGPGKGSSATVALSESIAARGSNPRESEIADLHAIGELIYQLVRGAEASGTASWPLKLTPEWSVVFRKRAEDWLKLCDDLLDPTDSRIQTMTLEDLEGKLIELEPKPIVSTRATVTAFAVLGTAIVVCGSYALLSYLKSLSGKPRITGVLPGDNSNRLARLDKRLADWEVFFELEKPPPGKDVQPIKLPELSGVTRDWLLEEFNKLESAYKDAGKTSPSNDFNGRFARLQQKIRQLQ